MDSYFSVLIKSLLLVLIMFLGISSAHACVARIWVVTADRQNGHFAGDVVSVSIHDTIADCNIYAENAAQLLPLQNSEEAWEMIDSMTFTCKVPSTCTPSDASTVEPFTFVYLKSYYKLGLSYKDMKKKMREYIERTYPR